MRSFRKRTLAVCLATAAAAVMVTHARLIDLTANTIAASPVEAALYRMMPLPVHAVLARRAPEESVEQLSSLIKKSPPQADLYSIRAQEEERKLDFAAAETDWKQAAKLNSSAAALVDLADFYARRLEPALEIQNLLAAAKLPAVGLDRFRPAGEQESWKLFERALHVSAEALLAPDERNGIYEAWIARYSGFPQPYQSFLDALVTPADVQRARELQTQIVQRFPNDAELQVETAAQIAKLTGGDALELRVYSEHLAPDWPAPLRQRYYKLLKDGHQLRAFLAEARALSAANPQDLTPVVRLVFYYEGEDNRQAAARELLLWEGRRTGGATSFQPVELRSAAPLFSRTGNYDEAAHLYYLLYLSPQANEADHAFGLSGLITLLLDVPEQPMQFGSRDLSLYQNVAQMDRHPGFLNGIFSLALNSTGPSDEYANASQTAVAYFHRAAAARLIDTFRTKFPKSTEAAALEAKLFEAYATYGQNDALVRLTPQWLDRNADSTAYVNTALLLADAYSTLQRASDEFALYDRLLANLAAKSERVPLGPDLVNKAAAAENSAGNTGARSPEYARVLQRYISRLTEAKRLRDAIAVYRREIDANPDDPGLYESLALYVGQNRLDTELAATYSQAFKRFGGISWGDKLARLYLRRKQFAAYQTLVKEVTGTFTGTELASFLSGAPPSSKLNPVLYRDINLYAHRRFPHNLTFVQNLLAAYSVKATVDPAAYQSLLRENWFESPTLRTTFLEFLSRTGKLRTELQSLSPVEQDVEGRNMAALRFRAEGEAWLANYENAGPAFAAGSNLAPGERPTNARALSIERSLSADSPQAFQSAVQIAERDHRAAPSDSAALETLGEIYADRELFKQAAEWWDKIPAIAPGNADGYLRTATVFWDYFQFNDALKAIAQVRGKLGPANRFGYEAGAIHENQGDLRAAVDSYMHEALGQPGSENESGLARNRLLVLGRRAGSASSVEESTASAAASTPINIPAIDLRVALLEDQGRPNEIRQLLSASLPQTRSVDDAQTLNRFATQFGFADLEVVALRRVASLTNDPVEKLEAQLNLATFLEAQQQTAAAQQLLSELLAENANKLGIIRANVDFCWRQKQYARAVDILTEAAARAQKPYAFQFRQEAAGKAASAGDFAKARNLLDQLLAGDPYNADLLAQKASTYASSGDVNGLVTFYSTELNALKSSSLAQAEKNERIGGLQRGYIDALSKAQRYGEALEQYEQLLNRYPDDQNLARETARFADRHGSAAALVAYYEKAVNDSPRDGRWPLLSARIQTTLGNYEAAVALYAKATAIRPDRMDILQAEADLQTRLLHFADADKSYDKLYELSYHDTGYLEKRSELAARTGNRQLAVELVRKADIEGKPEATSGYVNAMRAFLRWRMFAEADATYKQLAALSGGSSDSASEAAKLEAEALTSLHRPADAIAVVNQAVSAATADSEENAVNSPFIAAIGTPAQSYLTPAEKSAFAVVLVKADASSQKVSAAAVAESAGLAPAAAQILSRDLNRHHVSNLNTLEQLQNARLEFVALGREAETALKTPTKGKPWSDEDRDRLARTAVNAYQKADDSAGQLRIAALPGSQTRQYVEASQFAELFAKAGPSLPTRLATLARENAKSADAVVQYVWAHGSSGNVLAAIQARGTLLNRTWIDAYSGLAALYFLTASGNPLFDELLGPRFVGAELASLKQAPGIGLRHDLWFYYAARFGDYRLYQKQSDADELWPAALEQDPAASNSYVAVADTFRELKSFSQALELYGKSLELSPKRADVYERIGEVYLAASDRDKASANWRQALKLLTNRVEEGPLQQDYWNTARDVFLQASRANATGALKPEMQTLLSTYAKRNGTYNFEPFIEGLLTDPAHVEEGLGLLLEVANGQKIDLFNLLLNSPLVPVEKQDLIFEAQIESYRKQMSGAAGDAAKGFAEQLQRAQIAYATYLVDRRPQDAWRILRAIEPESARPADLEIRAAAAAGHLPELMSEWQRKPESTPAGEVILQAAGTLAEKYAEAALVLKDFEYSRELEKDDVTAAAYFGLAEVRFTQKRNADALSLIRTATTVIGSPFENMPEAIRLLERESTAAEALHYAEIWKKAEPWNDAAMLAYARLKGERGLLDAVRTSDAVTYPMRVAAALEMRKRQFAAQGSTELDLLTHASITESEASQPYFVESRLQAAGASNLTAAVRVNFYREAISFDPLLGAARVRLAEAALQNQQAWLGEAALESYATLSYRGSSPPGVSEAAIDAKTLARVQEQAAAAALRNDRPQSALGFYDQALANTTDVAERGRIQKLREAADAHVQLINRNAARRPIVTDEVTQAVIVKPRLEAIGQERQR